MFDSWNGISPPPFLRAAPREDEHVEERDDVLFPSFSLSFTHIIIMERESCLPRDHVKRARGRRGTNHSIFLSLSFHSSPTIILLFSSPTTPLIRSLFTRLTPCYPSSSSFSFLPPLFSIASLSLSLSNERCCTVARSRGVVDR